MKRRRRAGAVFIAYDAGPLLDRRGAAAYLGIKPETLKKWTTERRITFVRIGGLNKYHRDDLEAFIASNRVVATNRPSTLSPKRQVM